MADLYPTARKPISLYKDRRYNGDLSAREDILKRTTTLYVGNLSFYTREEQVFELFSKAGEIQKIIMGLDRIRKTPCGFCFVVYFTRQAAENSVRFLSGSKLDSRTIRVDYDTGFVPGREFGRGRSGGQVRDEHRTDFDPGRGGFGKAGEQSGMSGMQMWGGGEGPGGPPGFPGGFGGPDGGGGWRGRGRGRRRGRGRPRGYGPPPPQYRGFHDDGRGFRGRGPKRRRDQDDFQDWDRNRGKVQRVGPNGEARRSTPPRKDGTSPKTEDAPPTRNARFERGKEEE